MLIEINSDSDVWLTIKHLIREAGYRSALQQNLFDPNRVTLQELIPLPEPEGGELKHGLIVYPGGCEQGGYTLDSKVFETYQRDIGSL